MAIKTFIVEREVTITQVATVEVDLPNYISGKVLESVVKQFVEDDMNSFQWTDTDIAHQIYKVEGTEPAKKDNPFIDFVDDIEDSVANEASFSQSDFIIVGR